MSVMSTLFPRPITPDSIKIEVEKLHNDMGADETTMMKLMQVMREIEGESKRIRQNILAEGLFLILTWIGVATNAFVLAVPSIFMFVWLMQRGHKLEVQARQRMGYVDGIIYVLNNVAVKVNEAKQNPEVMRQVSQDVKETLEDLHDKS